MFLKVYTMKKTIRSLGSLKNKRKIVKKYTRKSLVRKKEQRR